VRTATTTVHRTRTSHVYDFRNPLQDPKGEVAAEIKLHIYWRRRAATLPPSRRLSLDIIHYEWI